VQLLKGNGGYSDEWVNYVWSEEKLVELLGEAGFKEYEVNNSMREQGYYFIIAKKV